MLRVGKKLSSAKVIVFKRKTNAANILDGPAIKGTAL